MTGRRLFKFLKRQSVLIAERKNNGKSVTFPLVVENERKSPEIFIFHYKFQSDNPCHSRMDKADEIASVASAPEIESGDASIASAPNKIIIAGEHSVVYGGRAVAAPVEVNDKRNVVTARISSGKPGVTFGGDLGIASLETDGRKSGAEAYFPVLEGIAKALESCGMSPASLPGKLSCSLEWSGSPKGTGNSASIPAATALSVCGLFGKKLSKNELFDLAYEVDNAYHAGKSSGLDPQTVCSDLPQEFKKIFSPGGAVTFEYKDVPLSFPSDTSLLLVDSYRSGEKSSTGAMVELFASNKGIAKKPADLTEAERRAITSPFDSVVEKIEAECFGAGDPERLGKLLDENHAMLKAGGVSSPDIERVLSVAKANGALGGKLVGAGGNGGAVIVLARQSELVKITRTLEAEKFTVYAVVFARKGASLDSVNINKTGKLSG